MDVFFKFTFTVPDGVCPNVKFTAEKIFERDEYVVMWVDPENKELCHTTYSMKSVKLAIHSGDWRVRSILSNLVIS